MRCAEIRGFNYSGSWGTSGLDLWQHHDHGRMAVEVARGRSYFPRWNLARWWLSHEAYLRDPERFSANLEAGLACFASHDIAVMPVLFNRWRDPSCDFGGVSLEHIVPGLNFLGGSAWSLADGERVPAVQRLHREYLEAVVGPYKQDPRIYAWDLCNEPLNQYMDDPNSPLLQGEMAWLTWCYETCKRLGTAQPLTVGNHFIPKAVELTEPISDLISTHPYYIWCQPEADREAFERGLDRIAAFAQSKGKELLASETVWGALDDAVHVEVMRYTLTQLREREIGFVVHALQHSLVADLHYPAYGPVGTAQYMGFVNPDGSLRAGHEAFNEF